MALISSLIGGVLLYFIAELVVGLLFGGFSTATRPIHRPIWAASMRASWPWPALVLGALGIASAVAGGILSMRPNAPSWSDRLGGILFLGGLLVALIGPPMWFHERDRATQSERGEDHPPS